MWVFLNGKFVPEEEAIVSVFDRSFRYGDGLFEAVLVRHGKMFRWLQHAQRLERSARFFEIALPFPLAALETAARELISRNDAKEVVLRFQLSRGVGPRGYAPSGDEKPFVVMSVHPAPDRTTQSSARWKLTASSIRVPVDDSISHHKTCSRLIQVLAASEARQSGADETLLINTDGHITEGSTSNVFWIKDKVVCTPPIATGALPGVTRAALLELCDARSIAHAERLIRPDELPTCDGVFLSLTSRGVVEAESIDSQPLRRSPITDLLQREFEALVDRECSNSDAPPA
jgi:aminodeoxychorismate lyase